MSAMMLLALLMYVVPTVGGAPLQVSGVTGDTIFLRAAASYVVSSRRRDEMVPDSVLARAVETYRRLFGSSPPRIAMFLSGDNSAAVDTPPSAKDTVWLSPTDTDMARGVTSRLVSTRYVLLALASGWVRAAIERAADSSRGRLPGLHTQDDSVRDNQSLAAIPRWLELGTAVQIAYAGVSWEQAMSDAQRQRGVPSLGMLLGNDESPSQNAGTAAMIQYVALLRFLHACAPRTLVGLPERLGRGDAGEKIVAEASGLTLAALETGWQHWYRATAVVPDATTPNGQAQTPSRCGALTTPASL
jgi:hypothetical protein